MTPLSDKNRTPVYIFGLLHGDTSMGKEFSRIVMYYEDKKYNGRIIGKIKKEDIEKYIQEDTEYLEKVLHKSIEDDNKDVAIKTDSGVQYGVVQTGMAGYHYGSSFKYYAQRYIDILGLKTTEEVASHFTSKGFVVPTIVKTKES